MIRWLTGNQTGPRQLELPPKRREVELGGLVVETRDRAVDVDVERMLGVVLRQTAQPVVAEELRLVDKIFEDAAEPVRIDDGEQAVLTLVRLHG